LQSSHAASACPERGYERDLKKRLEWFEGLRAKRKG
jgi:hypothetical protein